VSTEPSLNRGLQPGTLRKAAFVVLCALLALGGIAWLFAPSATLRNPVEIYLRQGERPGAAALKRDIDGWSPTGADPGPAVQNLAGLGFSCVAPGGPAGLWHCVMRVPDRERRLTTLEAQITVQGSVVARVETSISIRNAQ
jgi:hypothetical protein